MSVTKSVTQPMSGTPRRILTGRRILMAVGLLSAVASCRLFVSAVGTAREAARRTQCKGRFKQLELALHNYHDTYGTFPPAVTKGPNGRPWHSWRVLILPFIEERRLYERYRFDEPWDGPNNRELAAEFPTLPNYRCPSEGAGGSCNYLAVTGERTLWPPDRTLSPNAEDIPDGMSNTLHVVEVTGSGVH